MLELLREKCENLMAFLPTDLYICGPAKAPARVSKLHLPGFLAARIEATVKKLAAGLLPAQGGDAVYLGADSLRMRYLLWPVWGEAGFSIVLGPFFTERLTAEEVRYLGHKQKLGDDNRLILEAFFGVLPFYEEKALARLGAVVRDHLAAEPRRVDLVAYKALPALQDAPSAEESFEELSFVAENYAAEARILSAVEHGDADYVRAAFKQTMELFNMPPRFPSDPLREIKNLTITLNSLCVRAAIAGGLNRSIAHNMSHSIAVRIEQQTGRQAMMGLLSEIALGYAEAVRNYALKGHSELVVNAVRHIRRHINSPLSLGDLAAAQHVSKEHLSRQFAREMQATVTDYIHKTKVRASLELLASRKYGIGDIAFTFGYSSPSHYTKAFEKHMGVSPRQWREALKK